jgi:hypothetical protein
VASTTLPFRVAFLLLEVLLEVGDRPLHHLGRLEHVRQDQLAGPELVADLLHGRQQHVVEHFDRAADLERLVDQSLDVLLLAMHDLPVDPLGGRAALHRVLGRGYLQLAAGLLEVGDVARQRLGVAVLDQRLGQVALLSRDLEVRQGVGRVDDRQVQPGLDGVVQEDRVQHRPRARREAERDVRDAEIGEHARQVGLDQADAFERLLAKVG